MVTNKFAFGLTPASQSNVGNVMPAATNVLSSSKVNAWNNMTTAASGTLFHLPQVTTDLSSLLRKDWITSIADNMAMLPKRICGKKKSFSKNSQTL